MVEKWLRCDREDETNGDSGLQHKGSKSRNPMGFHDIMLEIELGLELGLRLFHFPIFEYYIEFKLVFIS